MKITNRMSYNELRKSWINLRKFIDNKEPSGGGVYQVAYRQLCFIDRLLKNRDSSVGVTYSNKLYDDYHKKQIFTNQELVHE